MLSPAGCLDRSMLQSRRTSVISKSRHQIVSIFCISTASAHPQQLGRFRACALLGLHSWGSSISARPFAPTRTGPADRIHGWYCAGNNGAGYGFFAYIAFRKWDGKYHLHPLSPGLVFYPRELESAGLSRLFYLFFSVVLRFADKNSPEFSPPRPRVVG